MDQLKVFIFGIIGFIIFAKFLNWIIKRKQLWDVIDKIPGPKAYPFIGTTWQFFGVSRDKIFHIIDERTKTYPYLHRIWNGSIPEARVYKAEYIEKILSNSKHIEKSIIYKFLVDWLGEGLLTSKGEKWFSHRKIITPTFHFTILEQFCEIFSEKSEILVKKLEKYANTNQSFDIYPYITRAALDIICVTAMGTDINAQDDTEQQYVKSLVALSELVINRLVTPWHHPKFLYRLTENGRKWEENIRIVHGFTDDVIKDRKRTRALSSSEAVTEYQEDVVYGKKKRLAFLDLLLDTNEKDSQLTHQDIREEVDTFMFEGHDTTTAGMSWSLFLIGLHDDVQQKIYEEIQDIFGDSDRTMTINDLNQMKYLDRVIKESLRLYPSVGFIGRQLSEELKLDEYVLPKECMVAIHIYHLHRDERFFPDAEKFDPDRFLAENTVERHPYAYVPFSAGPRNCIGQKFATLEEKAIISSIIRKYKIRSIKKREEVKVSNELVLRPQNGIELKIQKRNEDIKL